MNEAHTSQKSLIKSVWLWIVVITLILLTPVGLHIYQAMRVEWAVRELTRLGCDVEFASKEPAKNYYDEVMHEYLPRSYYSPVERIYFDERVSHPDDYKLIRFFPGLKELSYHKNKIPAGSLSHVGQLPHLESLQFHKSELEEPELKLIGSIKSLKKLTLTYCMLTDEDLMSISGLENLNHATLIGNKLQGKSLDQLAKLKHLEELILSSNPIEDDYLAHFEGSQKLRLLFLDETKITGESFDYLCKIPSLQHLYLGGNQLGNAKLNQLMNLVELKTIKIEGGIVSELLLDDFHGHSSFRTLYLNDIKLAENSFKNFTMSAPRVGLWFQNCGINDQVLGHLSRMNNMVSLNLQNNPDISHIGLEDLSVAKSLESLDLRGQNIDDKCLATLSKFKCLERVYVYNSSINFQTSQEFKTKYPNITFQDDIKDPSIPK